MDCKLRGRVNYAVLLALACMFLGCAKALPPRVPKEELEPMLKEVRAAAAEAQANVTAIKSEISRGSLLAEKLDVLESRIAAAEDACNRSLKKMNSMAVARRRAAKKKVDEEAKTEEKKESKEEKKVDDSFLGAPIFKFPSTSPAKEAEKSSDKQEYPEFSPSDAPIE